MFPAFSCENMSVGARSQPAPLAGMNHALIFTLSSVTMSASRKSIPCSLGERYPAGLSDRFFSCPPSGF
jgi:hypothetical protein